MSRLKSKHLAAQSDRIGLNKGVEASMSLAYGIVEFGRVQIDAMRVVPKMERRECHTRPLV